MEGTYQVVDVPSKEIGTKKYTLTTFDQINQRNIQLINVVIKINKCKKMKMRNTNPKKSHTTFFKHSMNDLKEL